ncbi:MAG: PP2C family protein-serine/threonine phosphatase [Chloroflexi bacterium]|nr:PP2C family protein-serine/threonine phosphatase [Chloroflexota bacterium]
MHTFFLRFAHRLHPAFHEQDKLLQFALLTDMIRLLYAIVLSIIGFAWLIAITDIDVLTRHWEAGLLTVVCLVLASQTTLFFEIKIGAEVSSRLVGDLTPVITWTFLWIFGPSFLWYLTIGGLILYYQTYRRTRSRSVAAIWQLLRNFAEGIGPSHLTALFALTVFDSLGGSIPVDDFSLNTWLLAFVALLTLYLFSTLALGGFILAFRVIPAPEDMTISLSQLMLPLVLTIGFLDGLHLFGVFGAIIQANLGWAAVIFYLGTVIVLGYVGQKLSEANVENKQRTQEMNDVTALGRALIDAPPDGSMLQAILKKHVPAMIANTYLEIVILPDRVLLHNMPELDWKIPDAARPWLRDNAEERLFYTRDVVSWANRQIENPVIIVPIIDREQQGYQGYIWVEFWAGRSRKEVNNHLHGVRALADQISAALHAEKVYEQMVAAEKTQQELAFAGQIQASFLPETIPQRDGWQIAAMIEPARQTSGDFFDFIELPDEKLGIVVADVADKGTGAALFMALARTLIRTYARQHPDRPAAVFAEVNERMLEDSRSGQFVTVFYGVLDPVAGRLVYANAGHNPGYFCNSAIIELRRTGIPLGMLESMSWQEKTLDLASGCPLVLYTDGVTEAQNRDEQLYDAPRLLELIKANNGDHAEVLKDKIVEDVHRFIADAPQSDDITVVVIRHI